MTIEVKLSNGEIVTRNQRIYFSDDAEYENGLHQPGDITEIGDDVEEKGWLISIHQDSNDNWTGVSPRSYAYRPEDSDWIYFADKYGGDFGPFGDAYFWSQCSLPIFIQSTSFSVNIPEEGGAIIVRFMVKDSWQCDDRNGDGYFNPSDMGGGWCMVFPETQVQLVSK
jgi:hypothetical protein